MRRARCLWFALCSILAVSTASAQARPHVGAYLYPHPGALPSLDIHIDNLLDNAQWLDALNDAYTIHVHWRVQLWRSGGWLWNPSMPPVEWEDLIQHVPVINEYRFTEPSRNGPVTQRFATLDSLRAWVNQERTLPPPSGLAPGTWYWTVDVDLSAQTEDQESARNNDGGALTKALQRLVLGGGLRVTLPGTRTVTFTVPPR